MVKYFSDETEAKEFAERTKGFSNYHFWSSEEKWCVVYDKKQFDLRPFINNCLSDPEFWQRCGIPVKEKYYINKLNMTDEQVHVFYEAMCSLQQLAKEIERQ